MMEEKTFQGHVYRRAGPGQEWKLVGPASGGSAGRIYTDPSKPREEARKDQDQQFEATRVGIAKRTEDRQSVADQRQAEKDDFERRLKLLGDPPKGMRPNAALTGFEPIPGYVPEKKDGADPEADLGRINALVRQINEVQRLFDAGPGSTGGVSGLRDFMPSGQNSAFDRATNSLEDIAVSAFKVPGMGAQSDADAARLAAAVKPNRWGFDQANRQTLSDLRARVEEWFKARKLAPPKWGGLVTPPSDARFGDQPDLGAALAGAGHAKIKPDGSVEVLEKDGTKSLFASTEDFQRGMAERRLASRYGEGTEAYNRAYEQQFGSPPPLTVDVEGGAPTASSRDTFLGGVDASIRGAADTATLGIADPLAAGVSSLFNGKSFSENWASQRQLNRVDEKVNPWWRFGGQFAGAVPVGIGLARGGAMALESRPLLGTALAETAGGGVYGGATNPDDPVAGALVGASASLAGNQLGQRVLSPVIDRAVARYAGESDPVLRALASASEEAGLEGASATIDQARQLSVPMALADADPRLRALAGSATRMSPNARGYAEEVIGPRGRAQAERAVAAIQRDFGPVVNMDETAEGLIQQGRDAAGPLYREAYATPVPSTPEIESLLSTPFGREGIGRSRTIAANERRSPAELGFALDAEGNAVLNPQPSREMAGHLFARQELDDAQQAYRSARTGNGDVAAARSRVEAARMGLRDAEAALAAAPDPSMAASVPNYTTQTLDYAKRGMDDVLEQYRNPITRRLDLDESGRAQNGVLRALLQEVDSLNPSYGQARGAYEQFADQATALRSGYGATDAMTTPNTLARMTDGLSPEEMTQFGAGFRTSLADQVNRTRFAPNPFERIHGTPDQVAKIGALFPEGAENFGSQAELEALLARTQYETLGGSPTASRAAADAQMGPNMGMQMAGESLLGVATGVPPIGALTTAARATLGDRFRMGFGGGEKADAIARLLLEPDADAAASALERIRLRQAIQQYSAQMGATAAGPAGLLALPFAGNE